MTSSLIQPWTRAELRRLRDDGKRYEVLEGDLLVTPIPSVRHQVALGRLFSELIAHCHRHSLGVALTPGSVSRGDSELEPDIAVYFDDSVPADVDRDNLPLPSLVVEIKSAVTRRRDVGIKRAAYLRWDIPEYWIVDTERQTITVARAYGDDEVVTDVLRWPTRPDVPVLEIALSTIFR